MKKNLGKFLAISVVAFTVAGCQGIFEGVTGFTASVTEVEGNVLALDTDQQVQLAGVYIPRKGEENYRAVLEDNIIKLLKDERFKFVVVLRKNIRYPKYDLVNAYFLEGNTSVNEKLLTEGMAFFDQGYYKGKRLYEKLESEAKRKGVGIWQDKNLVPLFVTKRTWWDFHYPECPLVKNLRPQDRVEYHFFPAPIFSHRGPADCGYCRDIEREFNRPKLFTYSEKDYQEEMKKMREGSEKSKTERSVPER